MALEAESYMATGRGNGSDESCTDARNYTAWTHTAWNPAAWNPVAHDARRFQAGLPGASNNVVVRGPVLPNRKRAENNKQQADYTGGQFENEMP